MIRFLVRTVGLLIFAASFIALIADGIQSLAADRIIVTPLGQTWFSFDRDSLNLFQAVVQRHLHPYIWDPIIQTVLLWPTFAVGGTVGLLLMVLGARRRPRRALT